jgi:non-specific serine/threonine protein kinase
LIGDLGYAVLREGSVARGTALMEESLALHQADGDDWGTAARLAELGAAAHARNELVAAARTYRDSVALLGGLGDRWLVAGPLAGLADLAASLGDGERAARLLGAVEEVRARSGGGLWPGAVPFWERAERSVRLALAVDERARQEQAGRRLRPVDLLAEADAVVRAVQGVAERPRGAGLSARELDVLRLLVAGKSNPEIAAALFVSPRTVATHVTHLFGKLGAVNRAEAVAQAVRRGLV